MAWEPYLLEARLALDEVRHRQFPAIACDALEAGLDGKTIRRIAGLVDPSGYEVDQLRLQFMAEAGLRHISPKFAFALIAKQFAQDVLDGSKDPMLHTRELRRLWISAGHPHSLGDIGLIDDDIEVARHMGESEKTIRFWVTERFRFTATADIESDLAD